MLARGLFVGALLVASAASAQTQPTRTLTGRLDGDPVRCEVDPQTGEARVSWRGSRFVGVSQRRFVGQPILLIPLRRAPDLAKRSASGAAARVEQLGSGAAKASRRDAPESLVLAFLRGSNPPVAQFLVDGRIADRVRGRARSAPPPRDPTRAAREALASAGPGDEEARVALRGYLDAAHAERAGGLEALRAERARLRREIDAAARQAATQDPGDVLERVQDLTADYAARMQNLREQLWEGSRRDSYRRQIEHLRQLAANPSRGGTLRRLAAQLSERLAKELTLELELYRLGEFEALDARVAGARPQLPGAGGPGTR